MHTIDLRPFQYCGTNITGIRLIDPETPLAEKVIKYIEEEEEEEPRAVIDSETDVDEEEQEGCSTHQLCL